jgi:hypothetical protein
VAVGLYTLDGKRHGSGHGLFLRIDRKSGRGPPGGFRALDGDVHPVHNEINATGWMIVVRISVEAGAFLFASASRSALGPTQPPTQGIKGTLKPGVRRPGREAVQSPPSSAEVKKAWRYSSTPQSLRGVVLNYAIMRLNGLVLS